MPTLYVEVWLFAITRLLAEYYPIETELRIAVYAATYLVIIANLTGKETLQMNNHSLNHRTLILRCWSEQDAAESRRFWRFHLQWLDTQERQSFACLEDLLASLDSVFGPEDAPPTP
jgi:hypothetical protein